MRPLIPGASAVLIGLFAIYLFNVRPWPQSNRILTYSQTVKSLTDALQKLSPESGEAVSIRNTLRELREKEFGRRPSVENPEAFLTALAEIKTGRNGEKYLPSYQVR